MLEKKSQRKPVICYVTRNSRQLEPGAYILQYLLYRHITFKMPKKNRKNAAGPSGQGMVCKYDSISIAI